MKRFTQHLHEAKKFSREDAIRQLAAILKTTEKNAITRAILMGLTIPCARCAGTGEYSFNMMHGTMCYGCNGQRYKDPGKSADAWAQTLKNARQAASSGKLKEYLDTLAIKKKLSKLTDEWFAKWKASGVLNYKWQDSLKAGHVNNIAHGLDRFAVAAHDDWTRVDEHLLLAHFYSAVNAYYATISDLLSGLTEVGTYVIPKKTSPQGLTLWLKELQDLLDVIERKVRPQLDSLTKKVPALVKEAKRGKKFTYAISRHRNITVATWCKHYLNLPNLAQHPIIELTDKIAGKWGSSSSGRKGFVWPHDE